MLCDNVLPNLNISRLAIGKLNTDVKSTYNTKIFLLWYPFQTIRTLLLLIGFPTNTKKFAASWYFTNFCLDKHVFSSNEKSCFFSLKMRKITTPLQVTCWNIQNPAAKFLRKRKLQSTNTTFPWLKFL